MLGSAKNDYKVKDFPTIVAKGSYDKQAPYNCPIVGEQKKHRFYALQANKKTNIDEVSNNL